jgi:ankyrin repeat protein
MEDIESRAWFTSQQVQEIRTMYSGCNEHKHLDILKELIRIGADVNPHDINGFTALHYAMLEHNEGMITVLLDHGDNPNSESRIDKTPMSILVYEATQSEMKCIEILIGYNGRVTNKDNMNTLRTSVEMYGPMDLAIKVREAHPRDKGECEKCVKPAPKQCGACGKVYYCTPACQKLDWKFHKITCKKKKEKQINEVD